jgi:imidazolonepropionase-like amidohydrolase
MLLIQNVKIYTMENDELLKGYDILVDGTKIIKIGKGLEAEGAKVIKGRGRYVTPGLVDAHTHLGLFAETIGFPGSDGNDATNPITPQLRAIDSINPMDVSFSEARTGGVTTVSSGPGSANVICGTFTVMKTYGRRIDEMTLIKESAMKCAFGENPKRVYNAKGQMPSTRMGTAAIFRETMFQAKEYLAKKEAAEEKKDMPSFDIKMEALIPVLKKEIPLKAHAHRADDIFTAIRIAQEFDVDLTLDHCTEGHLIADYLAKEGYPAIVGPSYGDKSKFELIEKSFKTPHILNEAGVLTCITTDAPVIKLEDLNMCAAFAQGAGMPELEALKAITIYPAKILKLDDRIGSIKEGKDADIVIWKKHPLEINSRAAITIIDGEIRHQ